METSPRKCRICQVTSELVRRQVRISDCCIVVREATFEPHHLGMSTCRHLRRNKYLKTFKTTHQCPGVCVLFLCKHTPKIELSLSGKKCTPFATRRDIWRRSAFSIYINGTVSRDFLPVLFSVGTLISYT
jgi:hypothetical protein